ncbi:hypothetical protein V8B55DRAFT_1524633 [Mucor lusitanicus]|uniref:Uncharacterized protein n=1 Tax=Mucor lusitanicus CBS 277.49 TaxID=747725 RepID=A0A168LS08_MUCCL|nr:hypothetical protein MUCCIDRAFT_110767 [Mucor lusitanicus CBS 277.49]
MSSRNPQRVREQADILLNNIEVITVDACVDRMFRMQEHKLTTEARMSQDLLRYLVVDNTPTSSSIIKDLINKETLKPVCKNNKASQFGARRY